MSEKKAINKKRFLRMLDNRLRMFLPVLILIILCVTALILFLPDRETSSDLPSDLSTEASPSTAADEAEATPSEPETDSTQNPSESTQLEKSTGAGQESSEDLQTETPSESIPNVTETERVQESTADIPDETQPAPSAASGLTLPFDLGRGLTLTKIGSYTGLYMEDGSNEIIGNVLMIKVENTGDEYIQYAEIALNGDNGTGNFVLTTLFPGQSMIVLEKDRKTCDSGAEYRGASAGNVAVFSAVPGLCEDRLEIQALDGVINVTNISGSDIAGDVVIYYKNSRGDLLYGGITYRIRITGGLKNGEIRQIVADHFSVSGSTVMFVTCE
ncbi:MAG: hypothetical protein IJZ85_02550 [Lachnospiraceae bacterium]|nr:hypothetical protein [Lachnospiraceae bacterium]